MQCSRPAGRGERLTRFSAMASLRIWLGAARRVSRSTSRNLGDLVVARRSPLHVFCARNDAHAVRCVSARHPCTAGHGYFLATHASLCPASFLAALPDLAVRFQYFFTFFVACHGYPTPANNSLSLHPLSALLFLSVVVCHRENLDAVLFTRNDSLPSPFAHFRPHLLAVSITLPASFRPCTST